MAPEIPRIQSLTDWKPVARGGFARVWQARQVSLDRLVAVKVYEARLDDGGDRRRFLQESAAAGRLSAHPNVVTVHDAGILPEGQPYLLMDLYPGGSLRRWLSRDERPTDEQVRHVGVRIADALAAAHAVGVVHRDVKPSNVLVDGYGEPALADFGLAVVQEGEAELSGSPVHATPAFAPPEVLRGGQATEAGDVFSLAATLHALLAGRPFRTVEQTPTTRAAAARLAEQPVPALPTPHWHLVGALADALAADPAARPTAAVFRDRLAALDLSATAGRRVAAGVAPAGRRRRLLVPLAVVAALATTGGSVAAWSARQEAPRAAASASTTAPPDTGTAGSSGAATPTGGPTTLAPAEVSAAVEALTSCQDQVRAADRVLREAEVGIGHWARHVQAQTDAFSGAITDERMREIFAETRLLGPADVRRYREAQRASRDADGSCVAQPGWPAAITTAMAACAERAEGQRPTLRAAAAGMTDWTRHLVGMQQSRSGQVHDAQGIWLRVWRAAPPHLDAWDRAQTAFRAPTC